MGKPIFFWHVQFTNRFGHMDMKTVLAWTKEKARLKFLKKWPDLGPVIKVI